MREMNEDQELVFTYKGEDLVWNGDIEVNEHSDPGDYWTPPYAECDVRVTKTNFVQRFNENTDEWEDVEVTSDILLKVELEFEKTL
jgi:hypothetical protein